MDHLYDGFISYSHAADDLLAPRLQSALQRFAKPWWKRRAVRIFRDESSLSANPHLWSSITEALDTSGWFVLLLSPDAAESEWVNQEIAYWVEHRDASRILPVVTDGEFGWAGNDVTGGAAPAALRSVFEAEPRWVDLRGVDTDTELDLQNPEFAAAVADIASTLRGIPKDELASEEVRQHRRTVRTAWAAGVVVAALGVASVIFGIAALNQSARADEQAALAREETDRAVAAERQALEQASIAEAGRLAAFAAAALESDAQLSMLLLLEAHHVAPEGAERQSIVDQLREAVFENRLLDRFEVPPGDTYAATSPDERTIYYASAAERTYRAFDSGTRELLWEYPAPDDQVAGIYASPLGDTVVLAMWARRGVEGRVAVVVDAQDGTEVATLYSEGCTFAGPAALGYSPDGRYFTMSNGLLGCSNIDYSPVEHDFSFDGEAGQDWAEVYDAATWELERQYQVDAGKAEDLAFSGDSSRALVSYRFEGRHQSEVLDFPSFDSLETLPGRSPVLDSSGIVVAYNASTSTLKATSINLRIVDIRSGDTRALEFPDIDSDTVEPLLFSPDGAYLSVVGNGSDAVVDVSSTSIAADGAPTYEVVFRLYESGSTFESWWTADSSKLLTSHDGEILLWEVVRDTGRFRDAVDSGDWAGFARTQVLRGFTPGECLVYDIDPCPSLEEMQSR